LTKRVGFCCKWLDHPGQIDGIKPLDEAKKYNTGATTVAWLNRQTRERSEEKLWDLMKQNIESIRLLVAKVGEQEPAQRMVRLSSDILPCYTEPTWGSFWRRVDVRDYCEKHLGVVGQTARNLDVRLSFHPGQFTVLASDNSDIVRRSIEEFEYHVDMARWMGYGATWHDHGFKINVHLSGRGGIPVFLDSLQKLTPEARNLITIENDEVTNGLDVVMSVAKHCAIVLDIHHHWCKTGEYINHDDNVVDRVLESWRDRRPVLHYSVSREDLLVDHDPDVRPDMASLIDRGFKKQQLRAHSDYYWNNAVNQWAYSFSDRFDIQCESKAKNLARDKFLSSVK
jgi:UV DNA damage endonuclease